MTARRNGTAMNNVRINIQNDEFGGDPRAG
jgi:hypothetical protein